MGSILGLERRTPGSLAESDGTRSGRRGCLELEGKLPDAVTTACFARYIAWSARAMTSSAVSPFSTMVTPMLMVTTSSPDGASMGRQVAPRMSSATERASSTPWRWWSTTSSSSPPMRATRSSSLTEARTRADTSFSTASPTADRSCR